MGPDPRVVLSPLGGAGAGRPFRERIRTVPSLFASYLRVYEPLTAFDRERQVFWRRYRTM